MRDSVRSKVSFLDLFHRFSDTRKPSYEQSDQLESCYYERTM